MGPLAYIALGAGGAIVLAALYAFLIEPRLVRIEELEVSLPDLPRAFDGLRVAHLTDLHVGGHPLSKPAVSRAVELTNAAQPDLVVLTGDLVHRDYAAPSAAQLLQPLTAPLGVWAVLGNHDYNWTYSARIRGRAEQRYSEDEWAQMLRDAGVTMLSNRSVALERDGERLWLAGCGDPYCYRDDLPRAMRSVREGEACVVLCHSPDIVDHPLASRASLILCGHTHGGQVRIPFIGPLYAPCRLPRQRSRGLTRVSGTLMYANRGVGASNMLRFHCPPEVAVITLRSADQE